MAELDRLIAQGRLRDTVAVQAAAINQAPRGATLLPVLPTRQFHDLIEEADVVISHAGPGTLVEIRSTGRVPVVVPRSPQFGEHVDDHQLRYASRLKGSPGYIVVEDLARLGEAIELARGAISPRHQPSVTRAVAALEALVGDGRARRAGFWRK